MGMKINVKLLILYLYAFILMYLPDFSYAIKINNFILLAFATGIYIVKYLLKKDKTYFSYLKRKPIFVFIVLDILATCYYAIRTLIAGTDITDFYNMRIMQNLMPILYMLGALIIYKELNDIGYTKEQKYKFIINVILIQSFIAISMIFLESLRNIALNIFYSNHEFNEYITQSRLYGICDGDYTYGFQILHGIFALFILMYAYFYKKKRYILYSIITLMVTFLNGRFGIIIFFIGILSFILYLLIKKMDIIKVLKILSFTIITGALMVLIIYEFLPNTFILIEHAYNDVISFVNEEDTANNETASLVSMIFFPTGLSIIFGCGFRIFGYKGKEYGFNETSDVGFVNDAFMGGVVYMILLYSGYFYLIAYIKKFFKKFCFERTVTNLFIICIFLANIKGEVFRSHLLMTNIILLLTVIMLSGGEKNGEK